MRRALSSLLLLPLLALPGRAAARDDAAPAPSPSPEVGPAEPPADAADGDLLVPAIRYKELVRDALLKLASCVQDATPTRNRSQTVNDGLKMQHNVLCGDKGGYGRCTWTFETAGDQSSEVLICGDTSGDLTQLLLKAESIYLTAHGEVSDNGAPLFLTRHEASFGRRMGTSTLTLQLESPYEPGSIELKPGGLSAAAESHSKDWLRMHQLHHAAMSIFPGLEFVLNPDDLDD